jgi:ankyrin repeat protein
MAAATQRKWLIGAALLLTLAAVTGLLRDVLLLQSTAACSMRGAQVFLALGANANARMIRSQPLQNALRCGNGRLIQFLLNQGADVNGQDINGHTPLWMASAMGSHESVALLLANGAKVDGAAPDDSPLAAATRNNHVRVVRDLLAAGARTARGGAGTVSDLRIAATAGAADVIPLLIGAGVPLESTDQFVETPLFHAARANARSVKALLDAGANVGAVNRDGSTPLLEAVRSCGAESVRLLLTAGADPSIRDKAGRSAAELTEQCSNRNEIRKLLSSVRKSRVIGEVGVASGRGKSGADLED